MQYRLYNKETEYRLSAAHNHSEITTATALTIGNFDGVHLGHKSLIHRLKATAQTQQLTCTALTFDPTPREYLAKLRATEAPAKLLDNKNKVNKLLQSGIDTVIVLAFDRALQSMSAQDFFHQVIIQLCQARALVIGEDFCFGNKRLGNITLLEQLGAQAGCSIEAVSLLASETATISSSRIRAAIADNDLATCNSLLGYDYFFSGRIVHGDGRGASIGYATANIHTELPLAFRGVFASSIEFSDGRIINGVTNIGTKPTFQGKQTSCETHLFDFNENIYNHSVTLRLHSKIRDEKKFDSIEQLIAQIGKDAQHAYNLLKEYKP